MATEASSDENKIQKAFFLLFIQTLEKTPLYMCWARFGASLILIIMIKREYRNISVNKYDNTIFLHALIKSPVNKMLVSFMILRS